MSLAVLFALCQRHIQRLSRNDTIVHVRHSLCRFVGATEADEAESFRSTIVHHHLQYNTGVSRLSCKRFYHSYRNCLVVSVTYIQTETDVTSWLPLTFRIKVVAIFTVLQHTSDISRDIQQIYIMYKELQKTENRITKQCVTIW